MNKSNINKYESSILLSLLAGVLVFLFSFDTSGAWYIFTIPVIALLVVPSYLLKKSSRKIFTKVVYWDIWMWPIWFTGMFLYSKFAYSNLSTGDNFWYVNIMSFYQTISSILVIVPLLVLIYYFITKNKQ
jgi:hypothetical protein